MAGQSHHFLSGLANNQQTSLRSHFGGNSVQNQMQGGGVVGGMQNLGNQMPVQLGSQLNSQMVSSISQMGHNIPGSTQVLSQLNQPYLGATNSMLQHSSPVSLPMQSAPMGLPHHSMQSAQILQQTGGVVTTSIQQQQQQMQQAKEFNTASLCRIGQETVQDIVSRTQEVFQTLKAIQPPNGTSLGATGSNEKKAKVQELLRTIRVLFKRLRLIYEKCNENCQLQGMEYTHIESLIPFKDGIDPKYDEKKNSEAYRLACEESKEVMEQVVSKNRQLKEIIDHLRRMVWEINTMLTMRRS